MLRGGHHEVRASSNKLGAASNMICGAPHEVRASSNMLCAASNMTCGGHHMVGFTVEKGLIRVDMSLFLCR